MPLNRRSFLSMTAIATTLAAAAACGSSDSSDSSGTVAADTTADLVIWADEKKAPSVLPTICVPAMKDNLYLKVANCLSVAAIPDNSPMHRQPNRTTSNSAHG